MARNRPPDGVHAEDLDSAVYYSLWMEIGALPLISPTHLQALKLYINTLAQYYVGRRHVAKFLLKVDHWLQSLHQSVSGEAWKDMLNSLQVRRENHGSTEVNRGSTEVNRGQTSICDRPPP